jgi:2OG-Fe(II) oxygenase superfamily
MADRQLIRPLDVPTLKAQYARAEPFPYFVVEGFLEPSFAAEVAAAYPTWETAKQMGFAFNAVNERKKVQVTERALFPDAVGRLSDALASTAFLADLGAITGIPGLLADERLFGGGIHVTGPYGRLDVHVDFNILEFERRLYRRLNLLLYLNPDWNEDWGGQVEFWDREVKTCVQHYAPTLNRCVVFETSDISYHGVAPLTCPEGELRRSFAAYYYTLEPAGAEEPASHSTIFRARPDERMRGYVLMPAERLQRQVTEGLQTAKRRVRRLIGRAIGRRYPS